MDTPSNSEAHNLTITSLVDLPSPALEGFRSLLQQLLPLANIPELAHLSGVLIVQDGGLATVVNALLQQDDDPAQSYSPSRDAKGVAVPIIRDGNLRCFILIAESEVCSVSPQRFLVYPANATLLEELLHVRIYSGLLPLLASSSLPRGISLNEPLVQLCVNALGEYLSNRWKAHLLSSYPLTAVDGGYGPVITGYPEALGTILDEAGATIQSIITHVVNATMPYDQGWRELLPVIYRGVLEPLARERAYRDGTALEQPPVIKPTAETSWFYTGEVAPYWADWLQTLQRVADIFDTTPPERVAAVLDMRETLLRFLNQLGVDYQALPAGRIHIQFRGGHVDL